MSTLSATSVAIELAVGETFVLSGAIISSVAWLYKGNQKRQDSQDHKLNEISTEIAVISSKSQDRDKRLDTLEKRVEEISGSVNTLSVIVEREQAIREAHTWDGRERRQRS